MGSIVSKYIARFGSGEAPRSEEETSAILSRCVALLRGGVAPDRVWEAIAQESVGAVPDEIAATVRAGGRVATALADRPEQAWKVTAVAWSLAEANGAPFAAALERIAAALRELERLGERRAVLLSGPQATIRMVTALPPLALLLSAALGFNPLPVLVTGPGIVLLFLGIVLLVAGARWANLMHRRVEQADRVGGIELELTWVALGGGAPPEDACRRVVNAVDAVGAAWVKFERFCGGAMLRTTIATAAATGVALRPLLLEEAASARALAHAELERDAERLGVRVLIPLGMCALPAFVALGVAPVLIAMLGGI